MAKELNIVTNTNNFTVYLLKGFFSPEQLTPNLHYHFYTEIHFISENNMTFVVDGKMIKAVPGDILVIPGGCLHYAPQVCKGALNTAFQINCNVEKFFKISLRPEIIDEFFKEIKNFNATEDYSRIFTYISFFCGLLFDDKTMVQATAVNDVGFITRDFFLVNYSSNITLSDLAKVLYVSERQAERLVIKYTGKSFIETLVETRMNMAKIFMNTTDYSLAKIANLVGYQSYSGFWKAARKYGILDKVE